ncbi:MAG: WecB/TagA/CpsF family glycosyltransferase [Trueperaceae bacterium]
MTLNPEIVVRARRDAALRRAINECDLCVADGVGVLWAAARAGHRLPERVPGVELATEVLARAGSELPTFLLGGRPDVAARAADEAQRRWGTTVVGVHDGYFGEEDEERVTETVRASGARLVLAGLGERQEAFLHRHRDRLGPATGIGVGGTLDVLAGVARRTPAWTRTVGLEWAWRVGGDPRRWHRAPRLLHFAILTLRDPRGDAGSTTPPPQRRS